MTDHRPEIQVGLPKSTRQRATSCIVSSTTLWLSLGMADLEELAKIKSNFTYTTTMYLACNILDDNGSKEPLIRSVSATEWNSATQGNKT